MTAWDWWDFCSLILGQVQGLVRFCGLILGFVSVGQNLAVCILRSWKLLLGLLE